MVEVTDLRLAELSRLAYSEATYSDKDVGVEFLAANLGNHSIIIAFRGTELNGEDITRDIRILPWWDRRLGFCHAGFLKGVQAVMPQVLKAVQGKANVYLTGHSKGGAEAAICAGLLRHYGIMPRKLVTFGAPRPGFGTLREKLQGIPQARYVNGIDAVPRVPPPGMFLLRYRHHRKGKTAIGVGSNPFEDHRINDYIEALQGI